MECRSPIAHIEDRRLLPHVSASADVQRTVSRNAYQASPLPDRIMVVDVSDCEHLGWMPHILSRSPCATIDKCTCAACSSLAYCSMRHR